MRSDLKAVENCPLPSPPLGVQQGGVQIPAPWRGTWAAQTNLRAIASATPAEGAAVWACGWIWRCRMS